MEPPNLLIPIAIGLALIVPAYFSISVFRRIEPESTKWQRTCTLAFFSYVVLIAMAVLMVVFAPWPFGMAALIPLAFYGFVRIRFIRVATNHARELREAGELPSA